MRVPAQQSKALTDPINQWKEREYDGIIHPLECAFDNVAANQRTKMKKKLIKQSTQRYITFGDHGRKIIHTHTQNTVHIHIWIEWAKESCKFVVVP